MGTGGRREIKKRRGEGKLGALGHHAGRCHRGVEFGFWELGRSTTTTTPQPASPTGINKLIMRAIRREKEWGEGNGAWRSAPAGPQPQPRRAVAGRRGEAAAGAWAHCTARPRAGGAASRWVEGGAASWSMAGEQWR